MLLNWARNRMNGPRFLPSGRRFGPYFWSRAEASAVSSPFSLSVVSRLTTSPSDIACHAAASFLAFVASIMLALWFSFYPCEYAEKNELTLLNEQNGSPSLPSSVCPALERSKSGPEHDDRDKSENCVDDSDHNDVEVTLSVCCPADGEEGYDRAIMWENVKRSRSDHRHAVHQRGA